MMRPEYGPPSEIVQKTTKHGQHISAVRRSVNFGHTGEVAEHEAAHVVASGGDIVSATIIPHGDALGTTVPRRLTAAGAAAAAALGHRGTGWDEFITEFYLGVPLGAAKAEARAALAGKELERKAVANKLQKNGTIFQEDVNKAYLEADMARRGVAEVSIVVFDLSGRKKESKEETDKDLKIIVAEFELDEEKVHQKDLMLAA